MNGDDSILHVVNKFEQVAVHMLHLPKNESVSARIDGKTEVDEIDEEEAR